MIARLLKNLPNFANFTAGTTFIWALERLVRDKHSSLFGALPCYGEKNIFYDIGHRSELKVKLVQRFSTASNRGIIFLQKLLQDNTYSGF
jgi:hypothetical protein